MVATIRKRGKARYQVRWWDHGVQRSKAFTNERDARVFMATVEVELARGDWLDPRDSRQPLRPLALRWLETQSALAPGTIVNIESRLRRHLLPALGDRAVSSLRPSDVEAWVASLSAKGLSASMVKHCYQDLSQVMRMAVRDRLIRQTPCVDVKLPSEVHTGEMHFLSHEEVMTLADTITPRYRALVLCAAYSGLRAGELAALRTSRLHLLRRRIEVVESVAEVRGKLQTGPPKNKQRRSVRIPVFLADTLGDHLGRYPTDAGFVFGAPNGGQLRHHNFYVRHYKPAVTMAGLPAGLRFHDLRHTCAALLIAEGWNLEQLKRHLGHSSIRVTSDRYSHLYEGHDDDLLDRLDARVRSTSPPPQPVVLDLHAGGAST